MKTKTITLGLTSLVIAGCLTLASCRKKSTTAAKDPDTDQTSLKDNNLSESTDNDIVAMGSQAAETQTALSTFKTLDGLQGNTNVLSIAPSATVTLNSSTKVITVDFGPLPGSTGADGRIRSGKLFFDYSVSPGTAWKYRHPGFVMSVSTTTASPYTVNGNTVTIISKYIANTTPLSVTGQTAYTGTNLTWSVTANISIVKAGGAGTVTWKCVRTKELTNSNDPACYNGQGTNIDWTKAKIKMNGTANGINAAGENYDVVATNLVRDLNCTGNARRHFVSGTLLYAPGSKPNRLLDYGSGTCDDQAVLLVSGKTFVITLP